MDRFVAEHLQGVSRTYAILIPMLPGGLADSVGLAYLLMRIVDTLEDAPELSADQRQRYLHALDAALAEEHLAAPAELVQAIGELPAERALMRALPEVLDRLHALDPAYRDAVRTCARTMIAGVLEFAQRSAARGEPYPAIHTAAELRSYCYYVAGVVGIMLCEMMAHFLRLPTLLRLRDIAVELGIGLQLVNILKDALKDSQQGRRYLPTPDGAGVSHAEVYKAVLNEARQSLQKGAEFVLALPAAARELRSFCGLPIAWGAMTLARAERSLTQVKIGRGAIRASITRFKQLAGDDLALRGWFTRLLSGPAGETPGPAPVA
jgi:farnesyl-diphosphate farnesyltransferase